jgi:hypothetical protein
MGCLVILFAASEAFGECISGLFPLGKNRASVSRFPRRFISGQSPARV